MSENNARSIEYYEDSLELASNGHFVGAMGKLSRAISFLEKLKKFNTSMFTSEMADLLADSYMRMGCLLRDNGDGLKAKEFFKLSNSLLGDGLDIGMTDISITKTMKIYKNYIYCGDISGALDCWDDADDSYSMAVNLLENKFHRKPVHDISIFKQMLADAYIKNGVSKAQQDKNADAIALYKKAINLIQGELGNQVYLWDTISANSLALAFNNLGNSLANQNESLEARASYSKAIYIWESLQKKLDVRFSFLMINSLARAYENLSCVNKTIGNNVAALEKQSIAINIWERLKGNMGKSFPIGFSDNLALGYLNRGDIYNTTEQHDQAQNDFQKAIALWEGIRNQLGTKTPVRTINRLAQAYCNYGELCKSKCDAQKAIELYFSAINIILSLTEVQLQNSPSIIEKLALIYSCIGNIYATEGMPLLAIENHNKANTFFVHLFSSSSDLKEHFRLGDRLAISYSNIANTYIYKKDYHAAINKYESAIDIYNRLYRTSKLLFTSAMLYKLARIFMMKGNALLELGDKQNSTNNYKKSISLFVELRNELGVNFTLDMKRRLDVLLRFISKD